MASLKIACITVGEKITAEQLIEKRIIMMTSKEMIMNIGNMSVPSRPIMHLLLLLHTLTAIQHASRVLSSREQSNALSKMT